MLNSNANRGHNKSIIMCCFPSAFLVSIYIQPHQLENIYHLNSKKLFGVIGMTQVVILLKYWPPS